MFLYVTNHYRPLSTSDVPTLHNTKSSSLNSKFPPTKLKFGGHGEIGHVLELVWICNSLKHTRYPNNCVLLIGVMQCNNVSLLSSFFTNKSLIIYLDILEHTWLFLLINFTSSLNDYSIAYLKNVTCTNWDNQRYFMPRRFKH